MIKSIKNLKIKKGARVLVRCDFNVPLSKNGKILSDFRIRQTIPTIEYLVKKRAKLILMSHLGQPINQELKYTLKPVAKRLEELLKKRVRFLDDCLGEKVEKEIEKLKLGEIILLENLRFYKEEEKNNKNFAKKLAKLADIYINDAFSVCHRAHASIVGVSKYLPFGAGFLLEKEIKILTQLMKNPQKPLVVIIGGKKVETKIKVINKFCKIADYILIGGLIKKEIKEKNIQFKYPEKIVAPITEKVAKDLDSQTIDIFRKKIISAKTIFWNGPLGLVEEKKHTKGSKEIIKAIIKSRAFSVVGGGETVEFINQLGLIKKFNYVSTGGSAMLEFLSGDKLPGIEALK